MLVILRASFALDKDSGHTGRSNRGNTTANFESDVCYNIFFNLYIKVKEDVITDVRFKICGCVAAIASASMTTVLVKGK